MKNEIGPSALRARLQELPGPIAVICQASAPPPVDGISKPPKPGGYRDSGADIAFALARWGAQVVTPGPSPRPTQDDDWTFGDSPEELHALQRRGVRVFWANTTVHPNHPLFALRGNVWIVGQNPEAVHRFEDKGVMHDWLRRRGFPVPRLWRLVLDDALALRELGLQVGDQAILKPVRGRGSQGVTLVDAGVLDAALAVFDREQFGKEVLLEEYLPGAEVTISVLPPGEYGTEAMQRCDRHFALAPVERFDHLEGVIPYSGVVPVARNSRVATDVNPALQDLLAVAEGIADCLRSRAAIRVDARVDRAGRYRVIDVNFKPNMTGPGRPGREDQSSLVALAAQGSGWSFAELVGNLALQCWRVRQS